MTEKTQRLARYVEVLQSGECVIETDISLSLLIEFATFLNRPFAGLYLIKALDPPETGDMNISPSMLIDKYEDIRRKDPAVPLPEAEEKSLWWLSGSKLEQVPSVVVAALDSGPIRGLLFGIKLYDAGFQTVLVPVVLFDAVATTTGRSSEEHNTQVLAKLQQIENNKSLSNSWLRRVHFHVDQAIRRLMTRGFAGTRGYVETDYEVADRTSIITLSQKKAGL